jgi:acyl-CoA reductase-like NAD-dependent aldehyde dehydrogenase
VPPTALRAGDPSQTTPLAGLSGDDPRPLYIKGRAERTPVTIDVRRVFDDTVIAKVCVADDQMVIRAIDTASHAVRDTARWPAHKRRDCLLHVVGRLVEHAEAMARTIEAEAGKPNADARAEVSRAIDTLRASAEEATRLTGEFAPLDVGPGSAAYESVTRRVPVGVCALITPFNFPLNLVAHKVGPAIAAGCPFILKPDPRTPLSALMLGAMLTETDLPAGAFSVLPVIDEQARGRLVRDDRIALLSFTGSSRVGWELKAQAGRKKVVLELGGVAPCIIDAPLDAARTAWMLDRVTTGAFALAGQSCISVQRVLVHERVLDEVTAGLVSRARTIVVGDPSRDDTRVGPLISEREAIRVEQWINEAVAGGARVLAGGERRGNIVQPTLIAGAPAGSKLLTQEVFGPVATIEPFGTFDQAIEMANATRYGLQAGVFTTNLDHAMRAWRELEFGGVVINDVPTMRVDVMPYGGVKDSGLGREGVRCAIADMTELRTMVLRRDDRR